MGSQRTPAGIGLAGILRPWRLLATSPGADYDEADPMPGADVTASTLPTRLALTGSPAATLGTRVTSYLTAQARPGARSSGGAWAWRRDGAGSWFGGDAPTAVQRAQLVDSTGTQVVSCVSTATTTEGLVVCVWGEVTSGGDVRIRSRLRSSPLWSLTTTTVVVVADDTLIAGGVGCCVVPLSDGRAAVYGIYSIDGGASWTVACWHSTTTLMVDWVLQSSDCLDATYTSDPPRLIRACVTPGGTTILYVVRHTSTSTRSTQYVSGDGLLFERVGDADGGSVVIWDARTIDGQPRVAYEINDSGTARIGCAKVAPSTAAWGDCTVANCFTTTTDAWIAGACIAENHYGSGWWALVWSDTLTLWSSAPTTGEMSSTLSTSYALTPSDGSGAIGQGQADWFRGSLYAIGGRRTASTLDGYVAEVRCGGQSDVTLSRWWPTLPQWIGLASADLSGSWADTDIGAGVTRTWTAAAGQRIQTDGVSQGREQSTDLGSVDRILALVQVVPTSGTCLVRVQHTSDGANVYAVHVQITATTIVMYDGTGAAGATTSITATGSYVTVMVWLQGSTARCWYRVGETEYPLVWSELQLTGITTAAGTTSFARAGGMVSSDVYLLRLGVIGADGTPSYPAAGDVDDVAGVALSSAENRYFADNMVAKTLGAPVRIDGVSHTITLTAPHPREHADPYLLATPSRGWDMSADTAQTVRIDHLDASDIRVHTDVWCLYLGGLHNVHTVTLAGFNVTTGSVDLRTAIKYDTNGKTVYPTGSGTVVPGVWVGVDELVGSQFELSSGTVRTIVGNTAGSLTYGSTVAQQRCTITLDGDGNADNVTGYIWPRDVCVIVTLVDSTDRDQGQITMAIAANGNLPSGEDTRTIGVLACGVVDLLGMAPDRTGGRETTIGDELVDLPDGTAYTVRRRSNVRRVEIAYVESPHDISGMVGPYDRLTPVYPSSDWVASQVATLPSADFQGAELLHTLAASAGRHPVVALLGCIPANGVPNGGVTVIGPVPWRQGCHYARIMGEPRAEQVPLSSDSAMMVRLQQLALVEVV